MPRMYSRPRAGNKVCLATPAYGSMGAGYTFALFESAQALERAGIAAELAIFAGDCHVDDARNRLVADFLAGDCDHLVFLDADLRWEPQDLVRLCSYDKDVVGASYPLKQDQETYPVRYQGGELQAAAGLLEVDALPTGFLRISRRCLQELSDRSVKFLSKSGSPMPLIFERTVRDGTRWGGDYTFCRKWKDVGGRIFVDPEVWLEHTGDHAWKGSLGSWLRRHNGLSVSYGLDAIREGRETPETYRELVMAWDNPWSATGDLLAVATELARRSEGPILELGSGITSLAMAAATDHPVHAVEHDAGWQARVTQEARRAGVSNLTVHMSPLCQGWYGKCPDERFGLVVCDGPPRGQGNRGNLFGMDISCPLLMDDVDDERYMTMLTAWAEKHGRTVTVMGENRQFALAA